MASQLIDTYTAIVGGQECVVKVYASKSREYSITKATYQRFCKGAVYLARDNGQIETKENK
jgi:hypothetical protein